MFPNGIGYTESISGGKEDTVNLNCSENDQQWRARWGGVGGVCVRKHGGHREEDRVTGGMQGRERSKKGKEGGGRNE